MSGEIRWTHEEYDYGNQAAVVVAVMDGEEVLLRLAAAFSLWRTVKPAVVEHHRLPLSAATAADFRLPNDNEDPDLPGLLDARIDKETGEMYFLREVVISPAETRPLTAAERQGAVDAAITKLKDWLRLVRRAGTILAELAALEATDNIVTHSELHGAGWP